MQIAQLADDFIALREPSGLFIERAGVIGCLIAAVRFYAGWAALEEEASNSLATIVETTTLTLCTACGGEWRIIRGRVGQARKKTRQENNF